MAALDRLVTAPETRLLTLTGPPGVGKTRLAIAVAAAAAPRFPDGVTFVDLTDIRDPPLVAAAVLEATGSRDVGGSEPAEQLVRALAGRNMLLVVDNFEHVLDAGLVLATALAGCAGLRLLLTSRERLHLRAEREVPVRPLGLPRDDDLAGSSPAPALEMLVQCVRRFDPGFDVTPNNCAALAEICARLDGVPLALELAAARLKLFTPGELTFRLRHRMSILVNTVRDVPRRHRTLRAALAWSHDLLKPDERAAFRRLSVFVGGATLDAAGQVCDLDDPVATITSLVDKSLLHRRIRPDGVAEFSCCRACGSTPSNCSWSMARRRRSPCGTPGTSPISLCWSRRPSADRRGAVDGLRRFRAGQPPQGADPRDGRRRRQSVVAARLRAGLVRLHAGQARRWGGDP